jgi:hypothetical protein
VRIVVALLAILIFMMAGAVLFYPEPEPKQDLPGWLTLQHRQKVSVTE